MCGLHLNWILSCEYCYEHVLVWCSDHIVDTWNMQPPPMNNPAHALRDKEKLHGLNTHSGPPTGTCLDCAKRSKGNYIEYGLVVGFIGTFYLVMLIVPIIVTVNNSAHLYGSG